MISNTMAQMGIHVDIVKHVKKLGDEMDNRILEFFGSAEKFKQLAHLFVVEHTQTPTIIKQDSTTNELRYSIETEMRIRPKTKEELEAEGRWGK